MLNGDPELRAGAVVWAAEVGLASERVCPLCRNGAGSPRHVVMSCAHMRSSVETLCDVLEAELVRWCPAEVLLSEADAW